MTYSNDWEGTAIVGTGKENIMEHLGLVQWLRKHSGMDSEIEAHPRAIYLGNRTSSIYRLVSNKKEYRRFPKHV